MRSGIQVTYKKVTYVYTYSNADWPYSSALAYTRMQATHWNGSSKERNTVPWVGHNYHRFGEDMRRLCIILWVWVRNEKPFVHITDYVQFWFIWHNGKVLVGLEYFSFNLPPIFSAVLVAKQSHDRPRGVTHHHSGSFTTKD